MDLEKELSESISVATQLSVSLHQQSSQIDKSSDITQNNNNIVVEAQVAVRRMGSYRYRIWYWIRDTLQSIINPVVNTVSDISPVTERVLQTPNHVNRLVESNCSNDKDDNSPRISPVTSGKLSDNSVNNTHVLLHQLTELSVEIGSELDRQNITLNTIQEVSEGTNCKLGEVRKRSDRLLR